MNLAADICTAAGRCAVGRTLSLVVAVGIPDGRSSRIPIGLLCSVLAVVATNPDPVAVADGCVDPPVDRGNFG